MLNVTLRQIEYATATARFGGVTAAAEALNISQPALSVALAQLEQTLGQPLFLRRPGGRITPTAFGRGWLAEAQDQLDALTRLMSGETPAAPVRLACFEDLAATHLAPLLRSLQEKAPDIAIAPEILPFEAISDGLRQARIDLAITWDLGLDASAERSVLQQVAPHAVAAANHPLAAQARRGITLAALSAHPLILADQGPSLAHMRALFTARDLPFTVAHRTATLDLMRSFAANGFGIGLSYTRPAGRRSHDGARLVTLPLLDAGTEPIILARTAGNPLPPPADRIARLIPDFFTPSPDSDQDGDA
ncbi:LysR family transcriptional regulator [Tabrizicola sp. TH137]|uniref:LysR family transcriptional regulator n=1 Tax=Tabrizicola sp. TH137 TaxID=2067452 RepID=UPI000C7AB739|nr:LysR family transcriptional regulator [Tabrizicola sp. TH137]PLL13286.1 LysR family transcriptional regulator [Tabrizicola sp. TH137]